MGSIPQRMQPSTPPPLIGEDFDFSNVADMSGMFQGCTNLEDVVDYTAWGEYFDLSPEVSCDDTRPPHMMEAPLPPSYEVDRKVGAKVILWAIIGSVLIVAKIYTMFN